MNAANALRQTLPRSGRRGPARPRSTGRLRFEPLEAREVPTFYGNQLFPLDNPWNQDISTAPVAANSGAIISRITARHGGTAPRIHADWGNPAADGALYGIPVNIATSATPKVNVVIAAGGWADESDLVQVPIPANAILEGDGPTGPAPPGDRGDSHLIVYDRDANVLYELASAARPNETSYPWGGSKALGVWGAYQISYFDLNTNYFRTIGITSTDAAGLPILPGLVRPDEVNPPSAGGVGVIDHAIRVTFQQTRDMFVFPASHEASSLTATDLPRMGERFRLKSSFVIPSTWSPEAKAIAQAMKTYGLIVADNGSDFYFQGTPSNQWNMSAVLQVQSIRGDQFEVVDLAPRVTGLSVTSGPITGGTSVTVTGYNFGGAAGRMHVLFGNLQATSVTVLSDTQLVAVAPAQAAGTVDVRVQSGENELNDNGQSVFFGYGTSPVTTAARFTYGGTGNAAPTISNMADRSVPAGQSTGPVAFTVGDAETPAGSLTVAGLSSNTALVPASGIVFGGSAANRTVTVTPAAGQTGTATITLTVIDGGGQTATDTFVLTVYGPPTANANSYTVLHDRTLTVPASGVLGNDASSPAGRPLTAALASGPANGSLTLNPNGSFTYTPNAGFVGSDSFTYTANDAGQVSAPATVSLSVTNRAPAAANNSYTVVHDRTLTVAAAAGVLGNDTDADGDALTAALATGPANGTVTLNPNGSFTYTPNAGFVGSDSFTYRAGDGLATSSPATVSLTVTNRAPVAANDSYSVAQDQPLTVSAAGVLGNDTDADGDALTAALATGPANGTLTLNADGSFTYTPNAGFAGSDSFTYRAGDGPAASSPATVSLTVAGGNQAPAAADDSYSVTQGQTLTVPAAGVLGNDTDADGDALTAALVGGPGHGTLALNPDGSFTYTPAAGYSGPDAFTYTANDGLAASAPATVNLTVSAAAAPPQVRSVVVNDGSAQRSLVRSITVTFDTVVTFDAGAFSLVRDGGGNPTRAARITTVNGQTVVRFTFSGSGTQYGSVGDGHWTFRVIGSRVHRADNRPVTMGADLSSRFHRLFGDADGDRDVDAADQAAFNAAFGQTDAASLAVFDYDNNRIVKNIDRNQFGKRFGRTI